MNIPTLIVLIIISAICVAIIAKGIVNKRKGKSQRYHMEDGVGGTIAQKTDCLADEDLVDDVIKGVHHHGDDARQGEFAQQPADRFCAQDVFFFDCFSHFASLFISYI